MDDPFSNPRFPKTAKYNPDWILASASGGANPLWLAEWLAEDMRLEPGMRVLDLGCGRAMSSIFLSREYGVQVWAADLWFDPRENQHRIEDAGLNGQVFPLQADARSLPFEENFFDAIVSIDSFVYYGTDDFYLSYIGRFLRPQGRIGIAGSGLIADQAEGATPLTEDIPLCLHSPQWWRSHWSRSRVVEVELSDAMEEGWQLWRDWMKLIAPDNESEIQTLERDAGRTLGYVRTIGRRRTDAPLLDPEFRIPAQYTRKPLLRE